MEELNLDIKRYDINGKIFILVNDHTYADLKLLDELMNRLTPQGAEIVGSGNFTPSEIEQYLGAVLIGKDGEKFKHEDFLALRESEAVKILADFFLSKARLGLFMQSYSKNLLEKKSGP